MYSVSKKLHWIVRFSWMMGCACKAVADILAVVTIFYQINYFVGVPFIIVGAIAFSVWASSDWMRAMKVSALFVANTFFVCFPIGSIVGFWDNPWLSVAAWLWVIAAIVCLLVRLGRQLASRFVRSINPKN